jgi:hypothetical protein
MAIRTLPRPCWTFTCIDQESEFARWREHAPGPAALELHGAGCDRPYELDTPCVHVHCDCCGIPFNGHRGGFDITHFPSLAAAGDALARSGWSTDGDGAWHCEDCPILLALTPHAHAALQHAA